VGGRGATARVLSRRVGYRQLESNSLRHCSGSGRTPGCTASFMNSGFQCRRGREGSGRDRFGIRWSEIIRAGSFSSAVPRRDRNSPFREGIIRKAFSGAIGHAPETHPEHQAKTDRHRAAATPAFARGRVAGRGQGASLIREGRKMDATRARRTRDRARQVWYARHRQQRFARFLGFTRAVPTECKASPSH
jgi:hypothetical protein